MDTAVSPFPDDVEALKALLQLSTERAAAAEMRAASVEAQLANARVRESATDALIAHLKLQIAKLKREQYGPSAERTRRLLVQMELQLEDLEAGAAEDDLLAKTAAAKTTNVTAFERKKPVRKPFPAHLPRERVVVPAPCSCAACGGTRLSKLGEDVTETLEVIPRAWKVIQAVREKFTCRDCEKITQPPAPFHVVPRGWAGPSFLAMLLFEKYGQHQPLNRQADRFARKGVPLSVSTLADQVGAASFALMPIFRLIEAHVFAAERLHGDDTTVPVMAKGKTDTARLWDYVRDDRPFAGSDPPAVAFYYSRDRRGEHPQAHLAPWSGILQADAYAGYGELYVAERQPGAILEAACFAHARRKFFELADFEGAARKKSRGEKAGIIYPIALEAVQKLDALFDIECGINGMSAADRGGQRAAIMYSLIGTCRLNDVDPQAWLADVLARSADYPVSRLHELLPWNWCSTQIAIATSSNLRRGLRRMDTHFRHVIAPDCIRLGHGRVRPAEGRSADEIAKRSPLAPNLSHIRLIMRPLATPSECSTERMSQGFSRLEKTSVRAGECRHPREGADGCSGDPERRNPDGMAGEGI